MTFGDLNGAVARLEREAAQLKYPGVVDEIGQVFVCTPCHLEKTAVCQRQLTGYQHPTHPCRLKLGDPAALLPILHHILLRFSRHVAQCIAKAGFEV